jgi:hypothetical protein
MLTREEFKHLLAEVARDLAREIAEHDKEPWLNAKQAGAYVNCEPRSLLEHARNGLPHKRLGKGPKAPYRFQRKALDEYFEGVPYAGMRGNGRR